MDTAISAIICFSLGLLAGFYAWWFFAGLKIFEAFLAKVTRKDADKIAEYKMIIQREFEQAAQAKGEAERLKNTAKNHLIEYLERHNVMLEKAYLKAYEDYRKGLENGEPFDPTSFREGVKAMQAQHRDNSAS